MSDRKIPEWQKKHMEEYAANPIKAHLWDATRSGGRAETPTLLLTTTGRKSGKRIVMPLIYGADGDRYIIVASKGGALEHPAWYLNLQANPQVDVQVAERKFRATARTATSDERPGLWKLMTDIYPPYPEYQERTERQIPVIILEPEK